MSFSRDGLGPQRRKKPIRTTGEAPTLGHVARMHKNSTQQRGVTAYAGRAPKVLWTLAFLLFVGGIAGVVLLRSTDEAKPKAAKVHAPAPKLEPRDSKVPVPEAALLEETVSQMLAARTPEQLEPLIRGSSQRPELIAEKLAKAGAQDGELLSIRHVNSVDSRCLQLESVLVTFTGGSNRLALLAPDAERLWRVDFDAYDRHVSPDWETLLSGQATEGTMRVYVAADTYYNGRYADDQQWASFGLASPDHKTLLFGYTLRHSPQTDAIANALRRNVQGSRSRIQRMTLEVRHTGTGDPRQFEITRVLADDWALGDKPLDAFEEERE